MSKENGVINKHVYEYMKKDKVFCYLVWKIFSDIKLIHTYYMASESSNNPLLNYTGFMDLYKKIWNPLHLEWEFQPESHDGRCYIVVSYTNLIVDRLSLYGHNDEAIIFANLIGYLKSIYISSLYNKDYFSWLKVKDYDSCKWVYNYLIKSEVIKKCDFHDKEELYLYCIVGFYLWDVSSEEKNEKYKKLILARNERKYRKSKKTKNKPEPSLELKKLLPKEVYSKLTIISQSYQIEENELLINLIDNEYNEITK